MAVLSSLIVIYTAPGLYHVIIKVWSKFLYPKNTHYAKVSIRLLAQHDRYIDICQIIQKF